MQEATSEDSGIEEGGTQQSGALNQELIVVIRDITIVPKSQISHYRDLEILYNKEMCHLQLKKRRFVRLPSKFYYKSGQ